MQQGLIQILVFLIFSFFGAANSFEACFVDVLDRWMFIWETSRINIAFMNVVDLWKGRVCSFNNETSFRNHSCEHVLSSHLRLSDVAKDIRVLIWEKSIASWKQLRISQTCFGTALHGPQDKLGSITWAGRFHLSNAFEFLTICTTHYFARAVQDLMDEPFGITLHMIAFALLLVRKCHFMSSKILWPKLHPECDCCYWMSLFWKFIALVINYLLSSRTMPTSDLPVYQTKYHLFDSRHHFTKVDPFIGKKTV